MFRKGALGALSALRRLTPDSARLFSTQGAYQVIDHSYDAIVVGAGAHGRRGAAIDADGSQGLACSQNPRPGGTPAGLAETKARWRRPGAPQMPRDGRWAPRRRLPLAAPPPLAPPRCPPAA